MPYPTKFPIHIGDVFSYLTVQAVVGQYATCLCKCGTIKRIRTDHLRRGSTTSCGCFRKENSVALGRAKRAKAGILVGSVFGQLTVISTDPYRIECRCSCGATTRVRGNHLLQGNTLSCGCGRLTQDGLSRSKEYASWTGMNDRCHNPSTPAFQQYGARGITVCPEWRFPDGLQSFLAHIGGMPAPGLSVDRIDNSKGYEPGNVRWATRQEQSRNRRTNHMLTACGKSQCLQAWENETGINRGTIKLRIGLGWTPDEAVSLPLHSRVSQCRLK